MIKQKVYLLLETIKYSKYLFCSLPCNLDKYLFKLIVLLKPDSNRFNNFILLSVDELITGT